MRSSRVVQVGSLLALLVAGCASQGETPTPAPTPVDAAAAPLARAARIVRRDATLARRLSPRADGFAEEGEAFASIAVREKIEGVLPPLRARVGRSADEAWELQPGGDATGTIRLRPEANARVSGALDHGRVVYRDVRPSTDEIVLSDASSAELLWVLRDAAAPTRFAFRVERAPGVASAPSPRVEDDGGLSFVDAAGAVKLAIAAPYAIDANGARRAAELSFAGDRLEIALDARGLAYPIVLDPYVGTARWTRLQVDPAARGEAQIASVNGKLVLIGGSSGTTGFADTWEFDGVGWTRKSTPTTPLPRAGFTFASLGTRAILFGGQDTSSGALLDETWAWDGAAWTKLAPAHKPPARRWAAMTAVGSKLVLYGGVSGTGTLSDTWEFDGTDWASKTTTTHPPTSASARMGASGSEAILITQAGSTADPYQTWSWNGSAWTDRTNSFAVPFARPFLAVAGGALRAIDFGQSGGPLVWDWSAASGWIPRGLATMPPDRRVPAVASFGGGLAVFGGYYGSGFATLGDLWTWDGTSSDFAQVTPKSAPSPRRYPAGATLDDRFVLFGGMSDEGAELGDTWEWDGLRWSAKSPATKPSARFASAFAGAGSVALLYGGNFGLFDDLWTWNHTTWTSAGSKGGTSMLSAPSLVRIGSSNVLYDTSSPAKVSSVWVWNGSALTAVAAGTAWPLGNGLLGAYGGRGVFVDLTFGEQWNVDVPAATFARDGAANAQDLPWNGRDLDPISLDAAHAVELGRFLFATIDVAQSGRGLRNEAWIWDGARWSQLAITGLPLRTSYALGKQGNSLVLFGGDDDTFVPSGDTYVLSLSLASGASCKTDAECDTGHCADGVCCNRACAGTCEACDVPGTAGTCTPISGAPKHGTCPKGGTDACAQAICDGKVGASCKGYVGAEVSCRDAGCASGNDVAAAKCNGSGACPAAVTHKCSPYACGAAACKDACRVDDECDTGFHCEARTGQCLPGAFCIDDRTLSSADGTQRSCAPFRCAAAACVSSCTSSDDCLGGYACDVASGTCSPIVGATGSNDGGGCAASGEPGGSAGALAPLGLLGLCALVARRRRAAGR
jgi:MYXO-CTERM domain-containing protein